MKTLLPFLFFVSICMNTLAQSEKHQQVFIMGTMHEVPKIVKNAYRPLLKMAIKYQPDAIYTEHNRSEDSLSLANDEYKFFLPYADSIASIFTENKKRTVELLQKQVTEMTFVDFEYLKHVFAIRKDKANWSYFSYLHKYGTKGSDKPLRHENWDLTAKLAIAMNMNYIFSMDYQQEAPLYNKLWKDCIRASKKDGQAKLLTKHNKRDYRKHILPAIFGNLGRYSNKISTIKRYEVSNRFTFRETPCDACDEAGNIWDRRNAGMAKNIGAQIFAKQHQKAIVIVGAGHVLGIKSELEKQFPELLVTIVDEL